MGAVRNVQQRSAGRIRMRQVAGSRTSKVTPLPTTRKAPDAWPNVSKVQTPGRGAGNTPLSERRDSVVMSNARY